MQRIRLIVLGLLVLAGAGQTLVAGAQDEGVRATEILPSSVAIFAVDCETDPVRNDPMGVPDIDTCEPLWGGSGTFISAEGDILTNGHVALIGDDPETAEPVWTVVGLTVDPRELPEFAFFARAVVYDRLLDLAIMQPVYTLDGEPLEPGDVDAQPIQMSESGAAVELEDTIRLIGYPGVGRGTVTVQPSSVAGYIEDEENPQLDVGFIKTNPGAAPGLSGGTAVNDAGELVGVPTQGSLGSIRCFDVDEDGETDPQTECGAMGGEVGFVRPVPEGLDLLFERAEEAGQLDPAPQGDDDDQPPEPEETPEADETPEPEETPEPDGPAETPERGNGGGLIPRRTPPTQQHEATALITGTIVSADTGDPIAGAVFVVLQPGTSIDDFVEAEGDPELIFTIGESNGRGRFQTEQPVEREEAYSVFVIAEGFEAIAGDDIVLATEDDPATVDLGEIELAAEE